MNQHLKQFLEYLRAEKRRSPRTLINYQFYLERFLDFTKITKPEDLTLAQVQRFRTWLERQTDKFGHGLKSSTQNYHLIALRSFLKYLASRQVAALAPKKVWLKTVLLSRPALLKNADLDRLLEAPWPLPSSAPSLLKLRDKAILEVLFSARLKVSALTNLKRESNDLLSLSNQARYWLDQYLRARSDANPYLFVSHDRAASGRQKTTTGLTPRSVERLIEKYKKAAGIAQAVSPETLRRR